MEKAREELLIDKSKQKKDRELLDLLLLNQGISIVPTIPRTKSPIRGFPLLEFFEGRKRATLSDISTWLKAGYDRAAIVGKCSDNLVVLDFDVHDAINIFFDKTVQSVAEETFTVKTNRGFSVWVKDPTMRTLSITSLNFRPTLDAELLVSHHLVSCPLNTHPSGSVYEGPLGTERINKKSGFIQATLERMKTLGYSRTASHDLKKLMKGVSLGNRNDAAFRYARYLLFEVELDPLAVLNELQRWNLLNDPPLPEKELEAVLSSALNYPAHKKQRRRTALNLDNRATASS